MCLPCAVHTRFVAPLVPKQPGRSTTDLLAAENTLLPPDSAEPESPEFGEPFVAWGTQELPAGSAAALVLRFPNPCLLFNAIDFRSCYPYVVKLSHLEPAYLDKLGKRPRS